MSETAYLDYNVVASVAGIPTSPDATDERAAARVLKNGGIRFVASAWMGYELARSVDDSHVQRCCDFVEELDPLWMSNPHDVERMELDRYLGFSARNPEALQQNIARMMATYGSAVLIGETFSGFVRELRSHPRHVEVIRQAAQETPDAISGAREPWAQERMKEFRSVIDREHLAMILGRTPSDPVIDKLMANLADVYKHCSAIAAEEHLSRVRLDDSFKPLESHAADFQHAVPALAYCDYFVSRDGQLRQHCSTVVRRAGLRCRLVAHVRDIQASSPLAMPT
jgi:hypothetical protein